MEKKRFMVFRSVVVYFAVAADRPALACNNQMRKVQAVEVMVQFVCSFVLLP